MKNNQIIKLTGAFIIISFLFFPVAGCGGYNVNGADIITDKNLGINAGVRILSVLSVICAVLIIYYRNNIKIFNSAICGIVFLFFAYLFSKVQMKSSNNIMDTEGVVRLKAGAYLSILGFIFSAYLAKTKKELFGDKPKSEE
ncbi:MAG: hypothetical protein WC223_11070 [Bacteroidales bacterium]|jgi:hypothetical protein